MPTPSPLPLVQGTLDLLVLRTLPAGPMHGYGIATLIRERTAGDLVIEEAALYQSLHRLDRQDLVEAEWRPSENNRRARYYTLTADGPEAAARGHRKLAALRASGRRRAARRINGGQTRPFWFLRRRPRPSPPRSTKSSAAPGAADRRAAGARSAGDEAARRRPCASSATSRRPAAIAGNRTNRRRSRCSGADARGLARTPHLLCAACCGAPVLALTIVAYGRSRHRRDDRHLQRRQRGAASAAAVSRARSAGADLHGHAAVQVPVLRGRLSGVHANSRRNSRGSRHLHRPRGDLQRRRHGAELLRDARGVVGLLLAARHHARARPRLHRGRRPPGQPPVVIASHGFWQQRLGGRADAHRHADTAGRHRVHPGRRPAAVASVRSSGGYDLFIDPAVHAAAAQGPVLLHRSSRGCGPGRDRGAAESELRAINRRIFPIWKSSYQDDTVDVEPEDLKTTCSATVARLPALALAAVALVWLIACTNASNLLVARVTSRRARAGRACRARRVARPRGALPPRRERGARRRRGAASALALAWVGVESCCRRQAAAISRARQEIAFRRPRASGSLLGADRRQRAAVRPHPGAARHRRPSDECAARARAAAHRWRGACAGSAAASSRAQFAIATPLLVVAGLLLAQPQRTAGRRSRLRHAATW